MKTERTVQGKHFANRSLKFLCEAEIERINEKSFSARLFVPQIILSKIRINLHPFEQNPLIKVSGSSNGTSVDLGTFDKSPRISTISFSD